MDALRTPEQQTDRRRERELQQYFDEAALLRTCLAYNEDDHRFAAEDGGRIVYLFDANIVAFFLQPERENERGKVLAFGSDGASLGYASSTALITAEFLFSRELAGQHGNPPLICPAHGDDLAGILAGMRKESEEVASEQPEVRGELQQKVARIVDQINRRAYDDIGAVARELRTHVPTLADELENRWEPLVHFRRIYDDDLLRPLAMHSAATREILEPDTAEVRRWMKRIHDERRKRPRAVWRGNEERDARALVQTMALDAAAREHHTQALARHAEGMKRYAASPDAQAAAPPPPQPVRYVLVTADQSLFDAHVRWYWNERKDDGARFVLRLPLQYVPIINTGEMPNSINSDELTQKAFIALDSLFGNLRQVDVNYTQRLAQYRLMNSEIGDLRTLLTDYFKGVDAFALDPEAFRQVRRSWHACYRNGTVLNASLMARRHRRVLDDLVAALRSNPDLRGALTDNQAENLDRIVGVHAEFTTQGNINTILKELREGGGGMPRHRVPFLVRLDRATVPDTILRLLEGQAGKADEDAVHRELRDALGATQSDRSLLLAAVIAFRRGHWIGARALARHGLTLAPSPAHRSELAYLEAAALRYVLGMVQERVLPRQTIDAAGLMVGEMLAAALAEDDCFAVARARLEEQALALTVVRRLAYETPEPGAGHGTAAAVFAETVALQPWPDAPGEHLSAALADQRATVILGAGIAEWLAGRAPDEIQRGHLAAALDEMDRSPLAHDCRATIHQAYRLVTQWLLGERPLADAAANLARLRGTEGRDPWRSALDRADIGRMADQLHLLLFGSPAVA